MFSFFKKIIRPESKPEIDLVGAPNVAVLPGTADDPEAGIAAPASAPSAEAARATSAAPADACDAVSGQRGSWLTKLKSSLRKTGSSIATVFTGAQIDDAL